ncbi:hypothetical protein ACTQZK_10465 [Paraeggerthella sp. LCP19S3_G8]|uniref:hypothetical protein n=1 Tax=Paraeggerthella sp. LCP19S3_G8 TaxID=3440248 RepID=UPI002A8B9A9D|nr:hypothetical protein [Paraeggerthella sp.]
MRYAPAPFLDAVHDPLSSGEVKRLARQRSFAALAAFFAAWCLMLALALLPSPAYAENVGADQDSGASPRVEGSFDAQSYASGERARVTFKAENSTHATWSDVRLEASLPSNVRLADATASLAASKQSVAPGESIDMSFDVVFRSMTGTRLVSTGDSGAASLALAACVVAFAVLACATFSRKGGRRSRARGGMSILVVVALTAGLAPQVPGIAHADEASSLQVSGSAVCASLQTTIPATLTVGSAAVPASAKIATVQVADSQAVSANARFTQVDVVSDTPFSEALSASALSLSDAFEGSSVSAVTLTGPNAATVRIDGDPGSPGTDGVIAFSREAFADASSVSAAYVSIESPRVALDMASASYEREVFGISLFVENGKLDSGATKDMIRFDDDRIRVEGFSVDAADAHKGLLEISVQAGSPEEQFEVLTAALDAFEPAAFRMDPRLLVGEPDLARAYAPADDRLVGAADAVDAVPYGTVDVTGVAIGDVGPAEVAATVQLGAVGGSLALSDASQILLPEGLGLSVESKLGSDWFSLKMSIDAETAQGWLNGYRELLSPQVEGQPAEADLAAPVDPAVEDEARQLFMDDVESVLASLQFELAEGVVLNKLGIAQGPHTVSCVPVAAEGEVGSAAGDAKTAFETLEAIANAIGSFCQQDKASIGNGIASLLGMIANLIDGNPGPSLQDIYDELQLMKGQLTRLETSVDTLAVKLNAVDKRAGYLSKWHVVKGHLDSLKSYEDLYSRLMDKLEKSDAGATYDDLSAANKKMLKSFANAVDKKDRLMSTTVVAETLALGSMLEGLGSDAVGEYNSWIETYYNWDPETFVSKSEYMESLFTAYVYGYGVSMAYLNTMDAIDDDDFFGPGEGSIYQDSIKQLKSQADTVVKKLYGTVAYDTFNEKTYLREKSAYRLATEPRSDGRIRCLLNDTAYGTDLLMKTIYQGAPSNFSDSVEKDDIHLYKHSGSITLAQWQQMWKNLPQVRGARNFEKVQSVYDELRALGFDDGTRLIRGDYQYGEFGEWHSAETTWYWSQYKPYLVAVNDAAYNKIYDQAGAEHNRTTTLDAFNLMTGRVETHQASWHHEVYLVFPVWWGYRHHLYPIVAVP